MEVDAGPPQYADVTATHEELRSQLQREKAERLEERRQTVRLMWSAFTQLVQVAAGANPLWDYLPSWHRYVPAAEAVGVAQSCADGSTPLLLAATNRKGWDRASPESTGLSVRRHAHVLPRRRCWMWTRHGERAASTTSGPSRRPRRPPG